MKWLKNIENIANNNSPGACPFCKSEDTDYSIKAIKRNYGYGVVWCNSCKKAFFISRIKASNERIINKNIPTDLVY